MNNIHDYASNEVFVDFGRIFLYNNERIVNEKDVFY